MITSHPMSLSTRSLLRLAIVTVLASVSSVALADLPRPAGWEPTCTLEKEQKKGGEACEQCRGWRDPDPCQKALEDKGFTRRCTEGGAGSFVAVWCKGPAGAPNAVDTPPTTPSATSTAIASTPTVPPTVAPATDNRRGSGMCSVQVIGQDKHVDMFWALVPIAAALGLLRRRASSRQARSIDRMMRKNALPRGALGRLD
jgi:hypothetical protein